jgi:hypothetical protein
MDEQSRPVVSLKGAVRDGVLLDLVLLFIFASILDDGTMGIVALFSTVAHWAVNSVVLLSRKARQLPWWRDFIRFGLLVLIVVALTIRCLLESMGVDFSKFI